MSEQETEISEKATEIQTGATPMNQTELPLHIPKQADFMAPLRGPAVSAQWTWPQLLSQEKRIGIFPIDNTTSQNKMVWTFDHTFDNVANIHFPQRKNDFRNYSWTLNFRMQFRSNKQQVGQIVVFQHNIPQSTLSYITESSNPMGDLAQNYTLITMLPHTKVAMGEDTDVHVEMPWNLPLASTFASMGNYSYTLPVNYSSFTPTMGSVAIVVPWQMQISANVNPQMTVEIWSTLTDLKLGGYDPRTNFIT